MGVVYIPLPLDADIKQWLNEENMAYPEDKPSRLPSLEEIKNVLSGLEGFDISFSEEKTGKLWEVLVEENNKKPQKQWTTLVIQELRKENNEFVFEKGSPELILKILIKLTKYTGALLLATDSGHKPIIITAKYNINNSPDWLKN